MQTILITTTEELKTLIAEHSLVMVDYYKNNCPGCVKLETTLSMFAVEDVSERFVLVKGKLEDLGLDHFRDLNIRATPTLSFYENGREVKRLSGYQTLEQVMEVVSGIVGEDVVVNHIGDHCPETGDWLDVQAVKRTADVHGAIQMCLDPTQRADFLTVPTLGEDTEVEFHPFNYWKTCEDYETYVTQLREEYRETMSVNLTKNEVALLAMERVWKNGISDA